LPSASPRMRPYHILIFLLLLLPKPIPVSAQHDQHVSFEQPFPVYIETTNLISDSIGKSRLDVMFRIPYTFFVFVTNTSSHPQAPYVATSDITVEVLDQNNISVARDLVKKEIETYEPPGASSEKQFLEGIFSFNLAPGEYSLIIEVTDLESKRKYFDNNRKVTLRSFSYDSLAFSDVLFCNALSQKTSEELQPLNFAGDIPFGKNFDSYLEMISPIAIDSLHIVYHLSKLMPENDKRKTILQDTLRHSSISAAMSIAVGQNDSQFVYRSTDSHLERKYSMRFTLNGDTLEQGTYELEVTASSSTMTNRMNQKFRIQWFDMPHSLRNIQFAIDALKYIATEKELKQLKSLEPIAQHAAFEKFWKQRDRTPHTSFNEVMEEYYKRVDYAFSNFETVKQKNGIETERGKTYILLGPPTNIDRAFSPSSPPKEIWTYSKLHKKLVFVDESRSGNYKLISTEGW
jgi:GWxTD domain-containing protein